MSTNDHDIDFSVDLNEFDPEGNLVEPGWYPGTIVSATAGIAQSSGFPKFDLRMTIEGGDYDGVSVFHTLSASPNARDMVARFLLGLGFDADFQGKLTADLFEGKSANFKLAIQPKQGDYEARTVIKAVKPLDATELASLV